MESSSGAKSPSRFTLGSSGARQTGDSKDTPSTSQTADGRSVSELPPGAASASARSTAAGDWGPSPNASAIKDMVEGRNSSLLDRCRQLLTLTHSSESLDAALALEHLLRRANALGSPVHEIAAEGRQLAAQFIAADARKAINVPDRVRHQFMTALEALEELEPGESPAAALEAFRAMLGSIKAELTAFMQTNLMQRWNTQATATPTTSPSASADSSRSSPASLAPKAPPPPLATSLGLREGRLEAFEKFLVQYKRVHYLDALETIHGLVHQAFDLSDPGSRSDLANQAEQFCDKNFSAKAVLSVTSGSDRAPEIRDAVRKIRSPATADPEGAAETLKEHLDKVHASLLSSLTRWREGFEALDKSSGSDKKSPR